MSGVFYFVDENNINSFIFYYFNYIMSITKPLWTDEEIKAHMIKTPIGLFLPFNYIENIESIFKKRDRKNLKAIVELINEVNLKSNTFYLSGTPLLTFLTHRPRKYSELEITGTFTYERELPEVREGIRKHTNHTPHLGALHPYLKANKRRFIQDRGNQSPEDYSQLRLTPLQKKFSPFKQTPIILELYTQKDFDKCVKPESN